MFSLTEVSISFVIPSVPEIFSSVSFILLVKLPCEVHVQVPRLFISRFPTVWVFFADSISTFRSWVVLFILYHSLNFRGFFQGFPYFFFWNFGLTHKCYSDIYLCAPAML